MAHPEPRLVGGLSLPGFFPTLSFQGGPRAAQCWPQAQEHVTRPPLLLGRTQRTWVLYLGCGEQCGEQCLLAQPRAVGARLGGSSVAQWAYVRSLPEEPAPDSTPVRERVGSMARPAAAVIHLGQSPCLPLAQPGHPLSNRASFSSQLRSLPLPPICQRESQSLCQLPPLLLTSPGTGVTPLGH